MWDKITEIKGINKRICLVKIQVGKNVMVIIQVYAPTLDAELEDIENFYVSL